MKQKIGIYGGCFNPIHNGHLLAAENVLDNLCLDKIIFVPTGNPPHKLINKARPDKFDRLKMTTLAVEGSDFFEVNDCEIINNDKSYSINTVECISQKYPDAKLYFLLGSDEFLKIEKWNRFEDLLLLCSFVVAIRPGDSKSTLVGFLRYLRKKYVCSVYLLDVPTLNISSTDIRNRITLGISIKHLVPEKVCEYISENNFYKPFSKTSITDIKKYLQENLSAKRFIHSINVANMAVELAKYYDEDIYKAYLAGLLHDCAKEFLNTDKIRMCNEYGVKLDRVLSKQPDLTHSFLAAKIAHVKFFVNDTDVLNAINYHTTGRKRMSMLEKIVYMADSIESNRTFDNIGELRKLTFIDINKAVAQSLKFTIEKTKRTGRMIHQLTTEAFQYYKSNL